MEFFSWIGVVPTGVGAVSSFVATEFLGCGDKV